MLANSKEQETTGAIAVLEDVSGLQDQRLAAKFNQEPAPRAVALSYFLSLYPNRIQAILRPRGCKKWTTISKHWPLPDETILAAIAGQEPSLYGLRWAEQTRFAVLDVDAGSKYHNAQELGKLQEQLAAVGLTATPYRSSESGGWHLYIFFDDWAECSEVENTIKAWLKLLRYEIKGGTLEIFPSGNALRLPLQRGFGWLDQYGNLIRTGKEITGDEALATFLFDLEGNQRNWSEAKNRIQSQIHSAGGAAGGGAQEHEESIKNEGFDDLFNELFEHGADPEVCEAARKYWCGGLTGPKQRHEAIYSLQHLLWFGDASLGIPRLAGTRNDERRYQFLIDWLERNHNGHSKDINSGQWREIEEATRRKCEWRANHPAPVKRVPYMVTEKLADALEGQTKRTGYLFTPADAERANIKREEWAREKIRAAVHLLTSQGRRVTVRQLMRQARCCNKTIKRHSDIWWISSPVSLPSVGGHLDPGGCAGARPPVSEICPDRFEEKKEIEILDVLLPADSGDLGSVQGSCSEELAPIVLTPPFLLPGYEPTSEPPASRPSPAGSFGSLDAGAPVRWYSGRTADGAGGLEPSCNQAADGSECPLAGGKDSEQTPGRNLAISSQAGLIVHSGVNSPQVQPFGIVRYESSDFDSAGLPSYNDAFRFCRYELPPSDDSCIRVNSLQNKALRILVYSDVRGPPKRIRA